MSDRFDTIRERMIQEQLLPKGITDPATLQAMKTVPRHLFVDGALQNRAYGDHPLPIAAGQTISQPYIVARMTQALKVGKDDKVLEIGTGSGYQAAVLSRICKHVYSVERINILLAGARKLFSSLRYYNILAKLDDGTMGWAEYGPYNGIIITAGGPEIPEPLVSQLVVGGRLVMPLGDQHTQILTVVVKTETGVEIEELFNVRFVDLIGEHGWQG